MQRNLMEYPHAHRIFRSSAIAPQKVVTQLRRGNREPRRATQPLVLPRLSAISAPCTSACRVQKRRGHQCRWNKKREVRTFKTTTKELLALSEWLAAEKCTHIAMEATGVYWKPVWHILSDGDFALVLANAAHVKNVPGRKTDVNDATWLADLLAHGLIRGSFVPDPQTQEMRDLLRTRKQLVRERSRHVQRLQKTLEDANIKLDSVISDVMGLSGRKMIEALIAGVRSPRKLADLADRRIKATPKELYDALHGRVTDHHRFRLRLHLAQYDALAEAMTALDKEIDAAIGRIDEERESAGQAPFRAASRDICEVPGVNLLAANMILAEIGLDMGRFPTAGHIVSWSGLCTGQNESAGKRKSSRLRKGAPWLKTTLVQCAVSASNKKEQLFQGAVPAPQEPSRRAESFLRGRRIVADRD